MDDELKAVQIIPAVGWRALYANEDGTGSYSDLVCWALMENGDIEPIDSDCTGYVDYFCRETQNFVGVYGPSVMHTEGETVMLVSEWKRRQKQRKPA